MDEIHFAPLGNHGKPLFIGFYRGFIINQGFSAGAGFRPSTVAGIATDASITDMKQKEAAASAQSVERLVQASNVLGPG